MARLLKGTFAECYDGDLFTLPNGEPRLWWIDPSIWSERHHPDTVNRMVESETLDRIYKQARALTRFKRWRNVLTGLERKAVNLELDYLKEYRQPMSLPEIPKNASQEEFKRIQEKRIEINLAWGSYYKDKWLWIAQRMGRGFTPLQVRSLLDEASRVIMDAETLRDEAVIELVYARKLRQHEWIARAFDAMDKQDFRGLVREVIREKVLSKAS